jgi:hypothetical protein
MAGSQNYIGCYQTPTASWIPIVIDSDKEWILAFWNVAAIDNSWRNDVLTSRIRLGALLVRIIVGMNHCDNAWIVVDIYSLLAVVGMLVDCMTLCQPAAAKGEQKRRES